MNERKGRFSKTVDLAERQSADRQTPLSHGLSKENISPNHLKGNGSVEFLPDGRAVINLRRGADLSEAVKSLREVLPQIQAAPTAKSVPDFRTERTNPLEFEEPEPRDFSEVEQEWLEELEIMRTEGKLTEQDEADLITAGHLSDYHTRVSEAYEAATACLTRGA